jgi:Restriction endonuclease EcoRV
MTAKAVDFLTLLQAEASSFAQSLSTDNGDWIVKGFIDTFRTVYTISADTKVISKLIEIILFPALVQFAEKNNYRLVVASEQNFYPDFTFIAPDNTMFALDLKTTYRTSETSVSGLTLGAFTGYFRSRKSTKNIMFPYGDYEGHFILGVIYSRLEKEEENSKQYSLDDLATIPSIVRDFQFFVQPKFRIAIDRPGSGNTRNIGSVNKIETLIQGTGPFAELSEGVFDDYWMYYLTADMARTVDLEQPPYNNLPTYFQYKKGVTS